MLLNPDPEAASRPGWYDESNEIDVVPTKTTLIVAPETLRAQWVEEIGRHAPSLDVYSYRSRTKAEQDVPEGLTWEQWARQFDVMILSYATLAKELSTAKSAPARSRRHERKYERPRSPLVKLHFHRVLMDEVQMIGTSHAAETVSMISRSSSIAVSGTPVKKMDDLKSCFRFLRVPGYAANTSQCSPSFILCSLPPWSGSCRPSAHVIPKHRLPPRCHCPCKHVPSSRSTSPRSKQPSMPMYGRTLCQQQDTSPMATPDAGSFYRCSADAAPPFAAATSLYASTSRSPVSGWHRWIQKSAQHR